MMLASVAVGIIIGMMVGRYFREPENECPAVELGYNCQFDTGEKCDHRKSELYKAKMNLALYKEDQENGTNYWHGNDSDKS